MTFASLSGRSVLVSGGDDGMIRFWDPTTSVPFVDKTLAHRGGVHALSFGNVQGFGVVASSGRDHRVRFWDPFSGDAVGRPLSRVGEVLTISFGSIGDLTVLAIAGTSGFIQIVDPVSRKVLNKWRADKLTKELAFGFVEGKAVLASAGRRTGQVQLWDPQTGERLCLPFTGHVSEVRGLDFGRVDGKTLLASVASDRILVVELRPGSWD